MLKNNAFLDDMAKLAGGAAGSVLEFRKEMEALVQGKVEECARSMQLVTREEFEVAEAMAKKARTENEALKEKLAELENKISKMGQ